MLLLLLATMPPVVWTDGGKMKLQIAGRSLMAKPGVPKPDGTIPPQTYAGTTANPKLSVLYEWLGNPESLPIDLLAALQESAPNASSSEVGTPAEHSPEVRAELIESLARTA